MERPRINRKKMLNVIFDAHFYDVCFKPNIPVNSKRELLPVSQLVHLAQLYVYEQNFESI